MKAFLVVLAVFAVIFSMAYAMDAAKVKSASCGTSCSADSDCTGGMCDYCVDSVCAVTNCGAACQANTDCTGTCQYCLDSLCTTTNCGNTCTANSDCVGPCTTCNFGVCS